MKTINFYKKDKLIFSVYADELDDVLAKPQDYFSGYTSDMIITDIKYEYPIFKDDRLREMTKEEKVRNNIPVQLVDGEFIKDKKLIVVPKPAGNQKYMYWDKDKWLLDNQKEFDDYCDLIDELKAKSLAYGFDYKVKDKDHRQKCRDTDIAKMVSVIVALQIAKEMKVDKKVTWYFEDNFGMEAGLQELGQLMLFGTTFVQSVYDTENYFKTEIAPKEVTKEEINTVLKQASENELKGILAYTDEPLVSSDFKGTSVSSTIDSTLTMVMEKNMVKVIVWYDNEWGYSERTVDLVAYVAAKGL